MALVSFESVAAAAESLVKDGGKASVRAVIAVLGGGSPNSVLPLLNEWKAGRVAVRSTDVVLDPRFTALLAEQITTARVEAAKTAEEKAADVQADAEAVAEAGREAEARATELELALEQAQGEVSNKARALEDLALERSRDQQTALETIGNLKVQIDGERERADVAVRKVAEDKVRLEALPKLEAEVQRLAAFEQSSAVLTAKLEDAQAVIDDLRQRLAQSEKATTEARAETDKVSRQVEQAHSSEKWAQGKLESATSELEFVKGQLIEAKAEVKESREELKGLRAQLQDKPKAEAQPKA
jgi:chromosome segregation ATPase